MVKQATTRECQKLFREGLRPPEERYERYKRRHRNQPKAAVAFKQEHDTSAAGTSVTNIFGSNVTAGSALFCLVSCDNTTGSAFTLGCSDNINGAWTSAGQFFHAFVHQAALYFFLDAGAGATTVTVTSTTSTTLGLAVIEYAGIAVSNAIDIAATKTDITTNLTTFTCPNVTTLNANDLILCAFPVDGNAGNTCSVAAPYTLRYSNTNAHAGGFGEQIVSSAGLTNGAVFTLSFSNNGFAITSSWKAALSNVDTASLIGDIEYS